MRFKPLTQKTFIYSQSASNCTFEWSLNIEKIELIIFINLFTLNFKSTTYSDHSMRLHKK